ncbi:hypothetical protein Tcan_17087 [Toxocara canis]|uniref:Uncharacterized protein n=2 Tax=Toxocara canis TaxID=6265 RepID=A0A0B2VAH9_TOXCA|nr:hypothetical protein Tcan_17087 [Toxocara canis]VDM43683.1 unnamed protein product [Toxocara canis]
MANMDEMSSAEVVEKWLNNPMGRKRELCFIELDRLSNMQIMLEHLRTHLSKDGSSQLKRLIGNIDNPQGSKRMKPISLSELNTADLCLIIAIMLERRLNVVDKENERLKLALEKANQRISKLERETSTLKPPKRSSCPDTTAKSVVKESA